MHLSILLAFSIALAITVAVPGPGIFAVVSCAIGRGLRESLALICGMVIGDLAYFTLAVLGLAALAHSMGEFFIVVKLAGAGYLIWLGVKLWRSPSEVMSDAKVDALQPHGFKRTVLGGFMVTIAQPLQGDRLLCRAPADIYRPREAVRKRGRDHGWDRRGDGRRDPRRLRLRGRQQPPFFPSPLPLQFLAALCWHDDDDRRWCNRGGSNT